MSIARRVLLVAPNDGASNVYIARGFAANGWQVEQFDYRRAVGNPETAAITGAVHTMNANLVRLATRRGDPFDLVLVLKGELVEPSALRAIRESGVPMALWHFDPRDGLASWVVQRARAVDHFFTIGKGLVPDYRALGVDAHWLLEGADPVEHVPRTDLQRDIIPVSFVGTVQGVKGRKEWLARLGRELPMDSLHLWGSFSDSPTRGVWHGRAADLAAVVSMSCVNLGRDRNPEIERSYGARLFRTLASGGFLVTNATVGIEDDFGGAVGVYETDEDCVDLVKYYLKAPDERRRIAERGRTLVLQRHLFEHRVAELVKACGVA